MPFRLDFSPCPVLAAVILGLHVAAAACVLLAYPRLEGAVLALLLAALGAVAASSRALLLGRRAPRRLEIAPSGEAWLVRADGQRAPARPVRGIGVTRWWVVLRLGGRGGFLVSAGMLAAEPFRRLRLWALWDRAPGVAPGQLPG